MNKLDRSLATIIDNKVIIDEDKLDIFDTCETPIPPWEPSVKIKPWDQVYGKYLDIETEGLDPSIHRITLIGLIDSNNEIEILDAYNSEKFALIQFFSRLKDGNLEFVATFNGTRLISHPSTGFDWWFIEERCKTLGIQFPVWKNSKPTTFRTAQIFGKPIRYNALWLNYGKTAVIDLYHQLLSWDFVARKLESGEHNLKTAPVVLGLRKEDRVTLSYVQMCEAMNAGNWDLLREYLTDDLKDTKLLGDTLIPALWNEKLYHPKWKFQSLTTSGNGSKWNDLILEHYKSLGFGNIKVNSKDFSTFSNLQSENDETRIIIPAPEPKKKIQGAITFSKIGLHKNVVKLDVESLYPHMMLLYGIHSSKDWQGVILSVLDYLLKFRINLKKKKAEGTITDDDKHKEGTAKVKLNSGYGFLAATGLEFNDMVAAAFVTAYGRATYKFIFKELEKNSCVPVNCDTDGLIFTIKNTQFGSQTELENKGREIEKHINTILPGNDSYRVKVKFEWCAEAVFVPGNEKGKALRKNYLVFRDGVCKTKKGKYRKRDRSWLEKEFPVKLVSVILYEGFSAGCDYYLKIRDQIRNNEFPVSNLSITRKIKSNEKKLVEQGIGLAEELITFYHGSGSTEKNKLFVKTGDYSAEFYEQKLNKEFLKVINSL